MKAIIFLDAQGKTLRLFGPPNRRSTGGDDAGPEAAQQGGAPFPAERFVNRIPVKKHDHVLIPAGTVHCSGANTMVLEISATPYILHSAVGLGPPGSGRKATASPLEHGAANIQWDRDTQWVQEHLINADAGLPK